MVRQLRSWVDACDWPRVGIVAYYGYFAINILAKAFAFDSSTDIYKFFLMSGMLLLAVKLVTTRYTLREFGWCCLFIAIGLSYMVITKSQTVLFLVLTVMGLKGCQFRQLLGISVFIRLPIAALMTVGSVLGLFDIGETFKLDVVYMPVTVYGFGFGEANMAYLTIFVLLMAMLYYFYEKLNFWWLLGTGAVAFFFYEMTFCRTGITVFAVVWVFILFEKFVKAKKPKALLALVMPLLALFSFVCMLFYVNGNKLMNLFNHFVSGRLYIFNSYYQTLGLSLFPRHQELFYANYFGLIDNVYMWLLLYGGWIIALAVFAVFCASSWKLYRMKRYKELVFVAGFAVYGMLEQFVLNAFMNPFALLAGILLYPDMLGEPEERT